MQIKSLPLETSPDCRRQRPEMNREQRREIPSQLIMEIQMQRDYAIQRSSKMSPVCTGRKKREEHIKPRYFWKVFFLDGLQPKPCVLPGSWKLCRFTQVPGRRRARDRRHFPAASASWNNLSALGLRQGSGPCHLPEFPKALSCSSARIPNSSNRS